MISVQIVDDDQAITTLLRLLLEGNGFQVMGTASNGQMAIDQFGDFSIKPDVILMDYRMPIKNGIDATIEILEISSHVKVIFATADEDIKSHAIEIGAYDVVSKPFDFDDLFNIIKEAANSLII